MPVAPAGALARCQGRLPATPSEIRISSVDHSGSGSCRNAAAGTVLW